MSPGRALAGHKAAPATCERQQHAGTGEIQTHATLHGPENASSFFNEASTVRRVDSVKDKDSLPNSAAALNRQAVSVQITRGARDLQAQGLSEVRFPQSGSYGEAMEGKARFIFPVMISALIVFVVSGVVTFTNIGLRADFVPRWLKAFITGWPVAAILAFIAVPHIRRATEAIVRLIEG